MGKINIPSKSHFRRLFLNSIFLFTLSAMSLFSDVLQISFFFRVSPTTKKEEIGKLKFIALLVYVHLSILQCCVCKLISNSVIFESNVLNFHLKKTLRGIFSFV